MVAMVNNDFVDKFSFVSSPEESVFLQIDETIWKRALQSASHDNQAMIRHASISGGPEWRLHVAEIEKAVACHVHFSGTEHYKVVAGTGVLCYGPVLGKDGDYRIAWQKKVAVGNGDMFVIPENYAHQLMRKGKEPLIILFACPDTHLGNDRVILD